MITTIALETGHCVELCEGDRLIGYVVLFSGGWDAWQVHSGGTEASLIVRNVTCQEAIAAFDRPLCEHNVYEGVYCEKCNRDYKAARAANGE